MVKQREVFRMCIAIANEDVDYERLKEAAR